MKFIQIAYVNKLIIIPHQVISNVIAIGCVHVFVQFINLPHRLQHFNWLLTFFSVFMQITLKLNLFYPLIFCKSISVIETFTRKITA